MKGCRPRASLLGGPCRCGWGDHLTDSLVRPATASGPFTWKIDGVQSGKTNYAQSGKPRGKTVGNEVSAWEPRSAPIWDEVMGA